MKNYEKLSERVHQDASFELPNIALKKFDVLNFLMKGVIFFNELPPNYNTVLWTFSFQIMVLHIQRNP